MQRLLYLTAVATHVIGSRELHVGSSAACVDTNAPLISWTTQVDPSGVFAYRVVLEAQEQATGGPNAIVVADSGFVFGTNEPFPGLYVFDNTSVPLAGGVTYNYTIYETQVVAAPGKPPVPSPAPLWVAGRGQFCMVPALPSPRDEARAALAGNFTVLYNHAIGTIVDRIQPSGYMPTSVSGGYGGPTNMFIRDTCAMLIALLEANCGGCVAHVVRVLNFTLASIAAANLSYAPHVMISDVNLTHIIDFDMADQTDGSFHLVSLFASYWRMTGDTSMAALYFPIVSRILNHYVATGARCAGGAGPAYFNASLGLLFNPNLEHSRCGVYWSTFDVLTNAFALEALRGMSLVADALGHGAQASVWRDVRDSVLNGVIHSLGYASDNETRSSPLYSELIGEPHYWWPGANNDWPPGEHEFSWPPVSLWGLSFINVGVAGAFFAVLGREGYNASLSGLDVPRFANTMDTNRRLGSFLWLTDDPKFSALVSMTHVNATLHADGDRAVIVKGLGWELAWAAYTGDDLRLLTLGRWLGFAAAGNLTLPAESYFYDCMRLHEEDCYGDAGNGEQAGWFVWGATCALKHVGLLRGDS